MLQLHAYAKELTAAHGLRLQATLLSNGLRLSSTLVDTLRRKGIKVMISLDGIGDQHDVQRPSITGKPSFHLVERTIAQLVEQRHPPHLSITVTNRNLHGVADVVRFALERDLTFSLNLFRDNDCAASFPDLRYAEQDMVSALLDAFAVIEGFLVGAEYRVTSCDLGIFVDQAAEPVPAHNAHSGHFRRPMCTSGGRVLQQRPVRPVAVIVIGVLVEDQPQVPFAGYQYPVQALMVGTGDPAFGYSVAPIVNCT